MNTPDRKYGRYSGSSCFPFLDAAQKKIKGLTVWFKGKFYLCRPNKKYIIVQPYEMAVVHIATFNE